MKNLTLLTVLLYSTIFNAQNLLENIKGENWTSRWTNFSPQKTEYLEPNITISGIISKDMTLTSNNVYLLEGIVYVTNNATLTIQPGTLIRGDEATCGTLVITKNSKLIAKGNPQNPIVFTSNLPVLSRKQGNWGGIVLLGNAHVNTFSGKNSLNFNLNPEYSVYGGDNNNDSSGVISYVRIEYAGRKVNQSKELNGISFAGVGKHTEINYIQVSYSNDDSFEFYGSHLDVDHLISYRSTDDDYDFTLGAEVNLFNSIALRNPFNSDVSTSRCLEIDSFEDLQNFDFNFPTKVKANNNLFAYLEDNNQGLIKETIFINQKSILEFTNNKVSNFKELIKVNPDYLNDASFVKNINIHNNYLNNCKISQSFNPINEANDKLSVWISSTVESNNYFNIENDNFFADGDIYRKSFFKDNAQQKKM